MSVSCEIPSEQPKPCIHSINSYSCCICVLESQVKALTDMYKEISCMVAGCQDHKIRQIDENRKISRRIDELEDFNKRQIDWNKHINERIEKLEKLINVKKAEQIICDGANLHLTILKFEKRMEELEAQLVAFDEDAEYLDSLSLPKRIEKLEKSSFEDMKNELICFKKQRNELNERIEACEQNYPSLWKKLKIIEDFIGQNYKVDLSSLIERIERLENIIKDNQGLINRIGILGEALHELSEENHKLRKKPYKCPSCNGSGEIKKKDTAQEDYQIAKMGDEIIFITECRICKGKGYC